MLLDTSFLWCVVTKRGETMDQDKLILKGRLDIGEFSVIDLPDGSKQGRKILSNAFKIFNIHKEKWYSLVCVDSEEKGKWMEAFEEAGVTVERLNSYSIDTNAKVASNMLLTDAERLDIMSKVRDGKMNVSEAMDMADSKEKVLQEEFDRLTRERVSTSETVKADAKTGKEIETMIAAHNAELADDLINSDDVAAFMTQRERLTTAVVRSADTGLDTDIEALIDAQNAELEEMDGLVNPGDLDKNPYKMNSEGQLECMDVDTPDDGGDK